jgi:hypothetical protein
MFPFRSRCYDLDDRDAQLKDLHTQLFLARQRGDKHNCSFLERQISRCGSSCSPIHLRNVSKRRKQFKLPAGY